MEVWLGTFGFIGGVVTYELSKRIKKIPENEHS
jgi:hypothetical protein